MPNLPLISDSHCHLDFKNFDGIREKVISSAIKAGVHRMVTICTRLPQEPKVRKLAANYPEVFYAAGTHPMNVVSEPLAKVNQLIQLSQNSKFVGIGETGLDYHYTRESAKSQKESLLVHISAAQETGLPLIIHSRAADKDISEILEAEFKNKAFGCVMHCYTSGSKLAKRMLDLGFYLSMSGIVAFPKSYELREIFKNTPLDRIVIETDSPYLAPPPMRGKTNQPMYATYTAKIGAQIFVMPYATFAKQTEKNFENIFFKTISSKKDK